MASLSKKAKRINGHPHTNGTLQLVTVNPKTINQKRVFDYYHEGQNLLLYGSSGTGKTFLALYLSLNELLVEGYHKQIVICRSALQSRNMGFLPGNEKEKMEIFEQPYIAICNELLDREDGYSILKQKKIIDFISTSFIRGITLNDCIVIVEECQNMINSELHAIITRLGENSRVIFCGDIKQSDFQYTREQSGFPDFVKIISRIDCFDMVEFLPRDIVRSALVRDYILAREDLEDQGEILRL